MERCSGDRMATSIEMIYKNANYAEFTGAHASVAAIATDL